MQVVKTVYYSKDGKCDKDIKNQDHDQNYTIEKMSCQIKYIDVANGFRPDYKEITKLLNTYVSDKTTELVKMPDKIWSGLESSKTESFFKIKSIKSDIVTFCDIIGQNTFEAPLRCLAHAYFYGSKLSNSIILRPTSLKPEAENRAIYFASQIIKCYKPGHKIVTLDGRLCNVIALVKAGILISDIILVEKEPETILWQKLIVHGTPLAGLNFIYGNVQDYLLDHKNIKDIIDIKDIIAINLDFCGDIPDWEPKVRLLYPNLTVYALTRTKRNYSSKMPSKFSTTSKHKLCSFDSTQVITHVWTLH